MEKGLKRSTLKKVVLNYHCPKCQNRTKFYLKTRNDFVGFKFTTEWYNCLRCDFVFPKNIKIVEKLRGLSI